MMQAAVQGAGDSGLQILGVTVLTSLDTAHFTKDRGFREGVNITELIEAYAHEAQRAGCAGVVCSPMEANMIRKLQGGSFLAVTPGIRPAAGVVERDDQSRIATPAQAVSAGADYLVVGRPIRDAADPRAAAGRIVQEMAEALQHRK